MLRAHQRCGAPAWRHASRVLALAALCAGCKARRDAPPPDARPHAEARHVLPGAGAGFARLGADAGLPQQTVWALHQDRRGFLWAGTQDGLARYDGAAFTTFRPDPTNPASLGAGHVWAIAETPDGALWDGTDGGGLSRFDPDTERFTTFRAAPNAGSAPASALCGDAVYSLAAARDGLWVGTLTGACRLDPATGRTEQPRALRQTRHAAALGLAATRDGDVWIASGGYGLARYRPATDQLTALLHRADDPATPPGGWALSVAEAADGAVWAGFGDGLARITPDGRLTRLLGGVTVATLHAAPGGAVWAGTSGRGLALVHADGRVVWFAPDAGRRQSLAAPDVAAVEVDRGGGLWVGLVGSGLARWSPRAPAIEVAAGGVTALTVQPDGTVWTVGEAGLGRFDGVAVRPDPRAAGTCASAPAAAVAVAADGAVWTAGDGLCRLDPATGRDRRYDYVRPAEAVGLTPVLPLLDSMTLKSQTVYAVSAARDGAVWAGTDEGLNVVYPDGSIGEVRLRRSAPTRLDPSVYTVLAARDGTVWAGTAVGLYHHWPARGRPGRLVHYEHRRGAAQTLSGTAVYSLSEGPDGTLWVGTEAGLDAVDPSTGRVRRAAVSDALGFPAVRAVVQDGPGRLWLATPRGLIRADVQTGETVRLDEADGLPAAEPVRGAAALGPDGRLLVGTADGLVALGDAAFDVRAPVAALALTAVAAEGRAIAPARWRERALTLPPGTDDLTVRYALLDLAEGRKARYRYRLDRDGAAGDWTDAGHRREAVFGQLTPGHYTFHVQAASATGPWLPARASLEVELQARWWATGWARGAAIGLVIALAVAAARARERQRAARRSEAARVRKRLADDLHDDLSGRVAALALAVDVAAHDAALGPAARDRLAGAARAARSVASDLRDATWAIDSGHDGLDALFDRLETAAQDALAGVPHSIERPDALPDVALTPDVRHDLLLVFKEALHNAARHGGGARVAVRLVAGSRHVGFDVQDDGPGFDPEDPPEQRPGAVGGRGLGTLHRRTARAGAALTIESTPGTGTRVSVRLPVPVDAPDRVFTP